MHLLVPFIAGRDISTDNTCQSEVELRAFFQGGALDELDSYKTTLEFHISWLEEGPIRQAKEERLAQINLYRNALHNIGNDYEDVVNEFLSQPSNLYGIQLRPREQDLDSRVINPVFTINRDNDSEGTPLSALYNQILEILPQTTLGKYGPREQLITRVINALPQNPSFEKIQNVLAECCKVPEDFFKHYFDGDNKHIVNKDHVDDLMGFDEDPTLEDYIKVLLGLCAPDIQVSLQGSPFYLNTSTDQIEEFERLSMAMQFYLGVINIYCRVKHLSDKNFGQILDDSATLSQELVERVAKALSNGAEVESVFIEFFNQHKKVFNLVRNLTAQDKDIIQQKFETTYRTVTATKENPHMDDFLFLETEEGEGNNIFITNRGLILTDFANLARVVDSDQPYFTEIAREALISHEMVVPQLEPVIIDITPEALLDKLNNRGWAWEQIPKEVVDAYRLLPAFKAREFFFDVAKGKQNEADAILKSSEDIQSLLRMSGKFTDYSGRTFNCTAYEYAYWAKDTHMQRMLESHMDDETKAFLLEKIDEIEHLGLSYQQYGLSYKNSHFDMSFVLRNLTREEFRQLQAMIGKNSYKIQHATVDNYQNISFTASEYEAIKKNLDQHKPNWVLSFFYTSFAHIISEKLQFDFHSLITALDTFSTHYDEMNIGDRRIMRLSIGEAQKDVPAHIAQEYCRKDRAFSLEMYNNADEPRFKEKTFPRDLRFYRTDEARWFPLSSSLYELGYDFALIRGCGAVEAFEGKCAAKDLEVLRHLDNVRTSDLIQSRENLSQSSPLRMVF